MLRCLVGLAYEGAIGATATIAVAGGVRRDARPRYANVSVLDVRWVDELHELLFGLSLFPYLDGRVTSPARDPNAINGGERSV